ncbi:hypothetical protein LJC02_02945 [Breznakia sp. OttesenSCG-928-G09]|nr:hypothetical protein [Breznakia sp. OttesenSCG-928-G09]
MKKPNFEDFLSTLDEETITNISDSLSTGEQINLDDIFTHIGIVDIQITIKLLNLYHDWIFEQLDK